MNAYSYVLNNSIRYSDPLGLWTLQLGISVNYNFTIFGFGFAGTGGIGAAIGRHGDIGSYAYFGGGAAVGTPAGSIGVHTASSNGDTICDLSGRFDNLNIGGGWGPDATGDAFTGTTNDGRKIIGGGVTVGAGFGAGGFVGDTKAYLCPIGHLW